MLSPVKWGEMKIKVRNESEQTSIAIYVNNTTRIHQTIPMLMIQVKAVAIARTKNLIDRIVFLAIIQIKAGKARCNF